MDLSLNELSGWNLAGQNLTNAKFSNPWGGHAATLTNTDLSLADLRASIGASLSAAITRNTILPGGEIAALHLVAGDVLAVRDYDGNVPITVLSAMTMAPTSTLEIALLDPTWGSTISFAPGIPVTLAGDLRLSLAPGSDPATLIGHTFQLFDWTGVSPTGQFNILSDPAFIWDTTKLYSTGQVTLVVPEPTPAGLLLLIPLSLLRRPRRPERS